MNDWNAPGDDRPTASGTGLSSTSCGGFPSREAILERYEELSGFSTKGVDYYRAFQYWRLAAIVEGVLSRYQQGVMGDQVDIAAYQAQTTTLAKAALDLARSDDLS
jgi:aminoglycoside phosphotransferase (APT) family kinase protein